ncbi:oxidoreductase [Podospora appendiculata]|uniref:Oxidoreductase n=1 Tax=Podospora appendiculata TaxID=314037 RepID=A0AAE0XF90_9PEZI|nr:oxidoreductase [Podospora appendiculata]
MRTRFMGMEVGVEGLDIDVTTKDEASAVATSGDESETDDEYYAARAKTAQKYNEETASLLEDLRDTMMTSHEDFVFACGGAIPVISYQVSSDPTVSLGIASNPVTIRWDPRDASTPASRCKLGFPVDSSTAGYQALGDLIADMLPAAFGLGGKDIYDEKYRKAAKMDPNQFSSNFSPYDVGIVDTITQILLPSLEHGTKRVVRAELYKLNVGLRGRGHFHPHVDTPRSPSQFGSLVVCLPVPHEGGELEVRHKGKTMAFDWSSTATDDAAIHWAAFYSDCEHEVFEVKSGHRLPLIYNLYAVAGVQDPSLAGCRIEPTKLPVMSRIESMLGDKDFMPQGGWLGFYTTHAYPHTSEHFETGALKGIDMVIWQGFQALNCGPNDMEEFLERWGTENIGFDDVEWLNNPGNKEPQLTYLAYGNEASTSCLYSYCAIIIAVPPYGDDGRLKVETPFEEREKPFELE